MYNLRSIFTITHVDNHKVSYNIECFTNHAFEEEEGAERES